MKMIRLAAALAAATAAGCTEPRALSRAAPPAPALEARLELSDSLPAAGSIVTVTARLVGSNHDRAASYTYRLSYDSTSLVYLGDVAIADGGTRLTNPAPGLLRSAGIRPGGFGDSPLAEYRFEVKSAAALRSMILTMDELHDADRSDATAKLTVRPPVVVRP